MACRPAWKFARREIQSTGSPIGLFRPVVTLWRQLNREAVEVARYTVEGLLRLQGVRRGKALHTTIADPKLPWPLDRVNRQFRAERPNQLWMSDFTYVSTWQGWVYVAFMVDVLSRRIVGWWSSKLIGLF